MANKTKDVDWPACQLMVVIEPGAGARDRLGAALRASTITAVLIRPKPGDQLGAGEVKPLVALAQDEGAVALIYADALLAKTLRADGVHLPVGALPEAVGGQDVRARVAEARAMLGADASIGVDAGTSRHMAMEAGEAGAEYVAFGAADGTHEGRQQRDELVAWWADIFEVPCVVLDVETLAEAEQADQHGADFVALTVPVDATLKAVADLVGAIDLSLQHDLKVGI